jgi:hypothetical protein
VVDPYCRLIQKDGIDLDLAFLCVDRDHSV